MKKIKRPKYVAENQAEQVLTPRSSSSDQSASSPPSNPRPAPQSFQRNTRYRVKSANANFLQAQNQESLFEKQVLEAKQQVRSKSKEVVEPSPARSDHQKFKKEIVKGACAVDEGFPYKEDYHVLQSGNVLYDCLMNQTNIVGGNNNNKFYIAQVLESDNKPNKYFFYTRWGRLGQFGQKLYKPGSMQQSIDLYKEKVYDKSVQGGYKVLHKKYVTPDLSKSDDEHYRESKLPSKVKDLIKLIFDLRMLNQHMMEIGYDPQQLPLGQLAAETINRGYEILKKLSACVNEKGKVQKQKLELLSSEFYSHIPHNFGFERAPMIKSNSQIKDKLEMLASLEQMQIAQSIIDSREGNIYDTNYEKLRTKIEYVEKGSEAYKLIEQYVKNTHASTHDQYKLKIVDVYSLEKDSDNQRFRYDIGNRWLLWHGSRLSNFIGILSQGLRIAPPEAPVTGYMFGKGVYFADMVSKSANYCCASKENPHALILLCDVALGQWQTRYAADYYANNLEAGCSSTKGVGKTAPGGCEEFENMNVPLKQCMAQEHVEKSDLLYNEYIVYDVAQIRLKYLIKLFYQFN